MAMDKINGSPLLRQNMLDRFRGTDRGGSGAGAGSPVPGDPGVGVTTDKADISDAARRLVDMKKAVDAGRNALLSLPDVREEKVATARERLATGFYQSVEVRQVVAGRVAGVLGSLDSL